MSDFNPVPWLRSGTGATPAEGGCVLQVIDWIDRNEWTDNPPCVHPVLARLAVRANDILDDEGRQRLLDLAPRLMGTTASDDRVLSVRLAVFCGRRVLPLFETAWPGDDRPRRALDAAEAWCDNPCEKTRQAAADAYAAAYAAYAAAAYAAAAAAAYAAAAAAAADAAADAAAAYAAYAAYDLLVAAVDEYDRLTGRTTTPVVDFTPAAEAMAAA